LRALAARSMTLSNMTKSLAEPPSFHTLLLQWQPPPKAEENFSLFYLRGKKGALVLGSGRKQRAHGYSC